MRDKQRILIVDDTAMNIKVLNNLLKEQYHISVATNGQDALEIINSENKPDMILLDIMMPGMDGYDVCKKTRENELTKEIPIIFLTAKTEKSDIIKGFEVGGQDYIIKPFNSTELLSRVSTHMELVEKRDKLKSINLLLEDKVAQRTEELNRSNKKLNLQNKELQNLDDAKSKFLKIISHEIRTPLNGISGLTNLLKMELESTEYNTYLEMLEQSAVRLEAFSLKALFITDLQTNRFNISKSHIDISNIIDLVITDLNEDIKKKKISIIKKIPTEFKILGNSDLFKFCIKNIIDNSIKFSDQNKEISIYAYQKDNFEIIEIRDYGKGFSEDSLKNLFKFFSFGANPTDNNIGLGLATVKLIMDIHSGNIIVQNNPEGSTVLLKFPQSGGKM